MRTTILFGIAILCPLAALTAQEIKPFDARPGLWESTTTIEMSGMMAGRGGAPRTTTAKSCVTRESLDKAMAFGDNSRANCTRKIVSSSSSKFEMHMDCEPDKMNMTMVMDVTVERVDAEHVKGSGTFKNTGTGPNGARTVESKVTFSNKWLSADCGDVKPPGDK